MTYFLSDRSKRHMHGIDPRLIDIANLAIKLTAVDFGIPASGGLRSAAGQNVLFRAGKSKLDGYRRESQHQTGKALDFYAYVDGKASWSPEHLAMVATAFLQAAAWLGHKIEWGGLWKSFRDMPHIQITD